MMMNSEIEAIFTDFTVNNVSIPVAYMFYNGSSDAYIVYSNVDNDKSYAGDDELLGYITYYDFGVYAKGNYFQIMSEMMDRLERAGWTFSPSKSSADSYDRDTGYYFKTLCFCKPKQTNL